MLKSMRQSSLTHSLFLLLLLLGACHASNENPRKQLSKDEVDQHIASVNKELALADKELIERYFQKREWEYTSTGSGLLYYIYKKGVGTKVAKEATVQISYSISLLDGTVCYGADSPVVKEFVVGMGKEISGLEEGVLLLREGDRAIIAIPPHLAHGLLGDEAKIPPRSTIIYNVSVEKVLQNK